MDINRIYSIVNVSDNLVVPLDKISNHIRRNIDNTKHLIEWIDSDIPSEFETMSHADTMEEMLNAEWNWD